MYITRQLRFSGLSLTSIHGEVNAAVSGRRLEGTQAITPAVLSGSWSTPVIQFNQGEQVETLKHYTRV